MSNIPSGADVQYHRYNAPGTRPATCSTLRRAFTYDIARVPKALPPERPPPMSGGLLTQEFAVIERIGLVGFGEVGTSLARTLSEIPDITVGVYVAGETNRPPYTDDLRVQIDQAGASPFEDLRELVLVSDVIFSVVWPGGSVAVAQEVATSIERGCIFVDMTSASPQEKEEGAQHIEGAGARYVDAVIAGRGKNMSRVIEVGHRVHLVVASNSMDSFIEDTDVLQMNLHPLSGPPGSAAMAKMLRSLMRKGMMALLWEAALMVREAGLALDELEEDVLRMPAPDLPGFLAALVEDPMGEGGVSHLERRAQEMEGCVATLRTLGVPPIMAVASAKRLRLAKEEWSRGERPEGGYGGAVC